MFLLPPLALLALANTRLIPAGIYLDYAVISAFWVIGIAALAWSRWPMIVMIVVGIAYTILAVPALPLLALLAVCSTGNCL